MACKNSTFREGEKKKQDEKLKEMWTGENYRGSGCKVRRRKREEGQRVREREVILTELYIRSGSKTIEMRGLRKRERKKKGIDDKRE